MVMDTVELTLCRHCNHNKPTVAVRGSLIYCQDCWNDINQRKSDKMLSLNIRRSKETRAAMSASKRVNKDSDPDKWNMYRNFYLDQLSLQEKYKIGA